jgi:hypothetical protein
MERNARRWLTCGEQLHADRSQKFSQWPEEGTTQIRECWRATTSPTSPRPKESRAGKSTQQVQTKPMRRRPGAFDSQPKQATNAAELPQSDCSSRS